MYKRQVIDNNGRPVDLAFIKATYRQKAIFSITDEHGKYGFNTDKSIQELDSISFEVTHLSFKPFFTKVSVSRNELNFFTFKLIPEIKVLNTVFVKPPVSQIADTTYIQVESFRRKTDRNLNDLFKNIPGFTVTPYGILFNGKMIQEIFIEKEKLSDNYFDLVNNLTPQILEEIQVIKNFTEIEALRGFSGNDGTVIDLKLKKSKKLQLSGNFEGGLGYPFNHSLNSSMVTLTNQIKSLLMASGNSIGFKPYSDYQPEKQLWDFNRLAQSYQNFYSPYRELSNSNEEFYRQEILKNVNQTKYLSSNLNLPFSNKKLKLNFYNTLFSDQLLREKESATNFYQLPTLNLEENSIVKSNPRSIRSGTEVIYNHPKLFAKVAMGYNNKKFSEDYLIHWNDKIRQTLLSRKMALQFTAYFVRQLSSKVAVEALGNFINRKADQSLNIVNSDSAYLFNQFNKQRVQYFNIKNFTSIYLLNFYTKFTAIRKVSMKYVSDSDEPYSIMRLQDVMNYIKDTLLYNNICHRKEFHTCLLYTSPSPRD